jgi:hypothetical protein
MDNEKGINVIRESIENEGVKLIAYRIKPWTKIGNELVKTSGCIEEHAEIIRQEMEEDGLINYIGKESTEAYLNLDIDNQFDSVKFIKVKGNKLLKLFNKFKKDTGDKNI